MGEYTLSIFNIADSMSKIADLMDENLSGHHRRVAYIAGRIAEKLNLTDEEQDEIVLAALMHDIGALSTQERLEVMKFESEIGHTHAENGYKLLRLVKSLNRVGEIIRHHHDSYLDSQGRNQHIGGQIIYMADRIDTLILKSKKNILLDVEEIRNNIVSRCGDRFMPELVEVFLKVSNKEAFWLDSISGVGKKPESEKYKNMSLHADEMMQLGVLFSQIIDFKCRFTATHSSGIAAVSSELARLRGFSERECTLMRFAGYVHDIGKLAVPMGIIEKPGKLTYEEVQLIKMHTYYTYQILSDIEGLGEVREWAAYHHEKKDGTGYPFGVSGDEISEGCKIMKVADIFTALREERPYRESLAKEKVMDIFDNLNEEDELLEDVIKTLEENYERLDKVRAEAQVEARKRYEAFIG